MPYTYNYPRPALTTDALLIARKENHHYILLIERKSEPFKGYWALPGGFVNIDEDLHDACIRELEEETGITGVELTQFETVGTVDRDPRGRTVSVIFWAELNEMPVPTSGDDASKAQWHSLENLPKLAFDHLQIITRFVEMKGIPC